MDPSGDQLTAVNPEAKKCWEEVNEYVPTWKKMLTPELKKLVDKKRNNIIKGHLPPFKAMMSITLYQTEQLGIYASAHGRSLFVAPMTFGAADWIAPEKTPVLNPQTGKPYIILSEKIKKDLSKEEAVYFETLAEVLNENLHYMLSPIPQLSLKEMSKGAYLGKLLLIPMQFKPSSLEDIGLSAMYDQKRRENIPLGIRSKRFFNNYIPKHYYDESYLLKQLANGNQMKFEIQKRLGAPLWNIGEIFSEVKTPFFGLGCYGTPSIGGLTSHYPFPFSVVPLTFGAQLLKGKRQNLTLQETYKNYFNTMDASFKTLQEDWQAELTKEGLTKGHRAQTPRQKALQALDDQLQPLIKTAERTLERQSDWRQDDKRTGYLQKIVKKKIPYSLLKENGSSRKVSNPSRSPQRVPAENQERQESRAGTPSGTPAPHVSSFFTFSTP